MDVKDFLDLPPELTDPERSRVVIFPVPYDATSTWRKGADKGPEALLEASAALEIYDIEHGFEPCGAGITTRPPLRHEGGPETLADRLEPEIAAVLEAGRLPVVIGGEHSVSIGAIRAAARSVPELSVLQIDAHADTREEYEGSAFNHACVMARAREHAPIVQVGIRSIDATELERLERERVWFAHEIVQDPRRAWVEKVIEQLSENVYLTIDLDAFDPSLLPATGTPEPGGLGWYDVIALIDALARARRVVGFDVVELCPMPGHSASEFIAAKLVYRTLAAILRPGREAEETEPRR